MTTQFKKGIVEICVLKVIDEKDRYGFEVIEKLAAILETNENTIYPILRRLTIQGLFTTYTQESEIGPPRKYYRITSEGKEKLMEYQNHWDQFLKSVSQILGGTYD